MFYKFLRHDLRYGIFLHWKRCIVTFLMFFCLAFPHFLVLRIYELIHPDFFNVPVTTADYFFAMVGGCGQMEALDGAPSFFSIPTSWSVFVLWLLFVSLYYPFAELRGIGKQLMVLSGSRWNWWFSKCVWVSINTIINFLLAFLASTACALLLGAKFSMQANYYVASELQMHMQHLTSSTTWDMGTSLPVSLFCSDRVCASTACVVRGDSPHFQLSCNFCVSLRRHLYSKPLVFGKLSDGGKVPPLYRYRGIRRAGIFNSYLVDRPLCSAWRDLLLPNGHFRRKVVHENRNPAGNQEIAEHRRDT